MRKVHGWFPQSRCHWHSALPVPCVSCNRYNPYVSSFQFVEHCCSFEIAKPVTVQAEDFCVDIRNRRGDKLFGPNYPTIDPLVINPKGVEKLLSQLNPSKTLGPDQIPCRILKGLSEELAPVFCALFKQSLDITISLVASLCHTCV